MATITNLSELTDILSRVTDVYFTSEYNKALGSVAAFLQLPIIQGTAELNTGEVNVTDTKLISGETWDSYSEMGDQAISLQIGSVSDDVMSKWFKKSSVEAGSADVTFDGMTYDTNTYDPTSIPATGGFLFLTGDRKTGAWMPCTKSFGSLMQGDAVGYVSLAIRTQVSSTLGGSIQILKNGTAAG